MFKQACSVESDEEDEYPSELELELDELELSEYPSELEELDEELEELLEELLTEYNSLELEDELEE